MQSIGHIIDDFIIIFIHAFADPVEHNAYKAIFIEIGNELDLFFWNVGALSLFSNNLK